MEFGAYSLLATGHSMSVFIVFVFYVCVCVCVCTTCVSVCRHLSTYLTHCFSLASHSSLIKLPVSTQRQLSISCRSELVNHPFMSDPVLYLSHLGS